MLYSVSGRVRRSESVGPDVARGLLPRQPDGGQNLNTRGLQGWIQDNIIPLILLGIAIMLLWIGGRGDNAGVARRSVGLIVGLIALGLAVSGNGPQVGTFLAKLITG